MIRPWPPGCFDYGSVSRMRTATVAKQHRVTPTSNSAVSQIVSREQARPLIVVIEKRAFFRDCLTHCLESAAGLEVAGVNSVEDWLKGPTVPRVSLVVLCTAGTRSEDTKKELVSLTGADRQVPVILLSDREETEHIVDVLDHGARGYLLTTMSLEIVVEALRLIRAGGMFVPASSLIAAQHLLNSTSRPRSSNGIFTARQAAVVEALRKGKANKMIAYELRLCESTVKVHVRNIMKKLKAKNRTEAAFMANELLRIDS